MKLITRFELAPKRTSELLALHCDAFNSLVRSAPESTERCNALASLDNVEAELAETRFGSREPGPKGAPRGNGPERGISAR